MESTILKYQLQQFCKDKDKTLFILHPSYQP